MTEPADLNPIPDHHTPWTTSGCTFVAGRQRCGSEDTATLSHLGRRCELHPPEFDPTRAVELVRDGWTDTAMSYVRWSA